MTSPKATLLWLFTQPCRMDLSLALAPNLLFSSTQQSLHVVSAQSTLLEWMDVIGLLAGASKARHPVSLW